MMYSPKDFLDLIKRSAVELLKESEYLSEEDLIEHVRFLAITSNLNKCYVNNVVYGLAYANRFNKLYYQINRQTGKRMLMENYFDMLYTEETKKYIGIKFPKPQTNLFKRLIGEHHFNSYMNDQYGQYSIADVLRRKLELFPEDNICVPIHRHGSTFAKTQLREWENLFKPVKD